MSDLFLGRGFRGLAESLQGLTGRQLILLLLMLLADEGRWGGGQTRQSPSGVFEAEGGSCLATETSVTWGLSEGFEAPHPARGAGEGIGRAQESAVGSETRGSWRYAIAAGKPGRAEVRPPAA